MNQIMGFNHSLLFMIYNFNQHQIIMLFYFDSKKNNSNFTSFKSTEIDHKMYGGCSSAGQSTWLWPRRPWVQVPSLTQDFSGYSVVRLTRLLWEQEIGSSNLSTPTLTNTTCLCLRASFHDGALSFYTFVVLLYQGCHL